MSPAVNIRIPKSGNLKYALGAADPFVGKVRPGELFEVECEINCNGGVITSLDTKLTFDSMKVPWVNPATGPIEVVGAEPGQALHVTIHEMMLDRLGYTALWPGIGIFPDWLRHKEFGLITKVVEVSDGVVHWSDRLKLPVKPMTGVIGTAPVHGSVITIDNGTHGGNIDVQEIGPGATIVLPVCHPGAHLFIGDCHAIQGDGEIQSCGGIEIGATVRASVELRPKPPRMTWPRFETDTHIGTIACARPLDDALRLAYQEMIFWLEDEYGIAATEAYLLLGQIGEARCTQMVNPKYTYVCKVDRRYLPVPMAARA
jgi:acetamidase/formamidase